MKPSQLDLYLEELDIADKGGESVVSLGSVLEIGHKTRWFKFHFDSILQAASFIVLQYIRLSFFVFYDGICLQFIGYLHNHLSKLHQYRLQAALIISFILIYTFQLKNIGYYVVSIGLAVPAVIICVLQYLAFLSLRGEQLCRILLKTITKIQSITLGRGFPLEAHLVRRVSEISLLQSVFYLSCRDAKKLLYKALSHALTSDQTDYNSVDDLNNSSMSIKQLEVLSHQLYHNLVPSQQQALLVLIVTTLDDKSKLSYFDILCEVFKQFCVVVSRCSRLLHVELTICELLPNLSSLLHPSINSDKEEDTEKQPIITPCSNSGESSMGLFDHYIHLKQSMSKASRLAEHIFIRLTIAEQLLQSSDTFNAILQQDMPERQQLLAQQLNQLLSLELDNHKLTLAMQLAQIDLKKFTHFFDNGTNKRPIDGENLESKQKQILNYQSTDLPMLSTQRQDRGMNLESGIDATNDIPADSRCYPQSEVESMTEVLTATVIDNNASSSHHSSNINKDDLNAQLQRKLADMMVDELKVSLQQRMHACSKQRIRDFDRNETSVEIISPEIQAAESDSTLRAVELSTEEKAVVKVSSAVVWSELQAKLAIKANNEHCIGESDSDKEDDT